MTRWRLVVEVEGPRDSMGVVDPDVNKVLLESAIAMRNFAGQDAVIHSLQLGRVDADRSR